MSSKRLRLPRDTDMDASPLMSATAVVVKVPPEPLGSSNTMPVSLALKLSVTHVIMPFSSYVPAWFHWLPPPLASAASSAGPSSFLGLPKPCALINFLASSEISVWKYDVVLPSALVLYPRMDESSSPSFLSFFTGGALAVEALCNSTRTSCASRFSFALSSASFSLSAFAFSISSAKALFAGSSLAPSSAAAIASSHSLNRTSAWAFRWYAFTNLGSVAKHFFESSSASSTLLRFSRTIARLEYKAASAFPGIVSSKEMAFPYSSSALGMSFWANAPFARFLISSTRRSLASSSFGSSLSTSAWRFDA
mmetsp:Transcript_86909/g.266059  ORF Transcript_86909/g.266059 Transcript_86909/m.266059 type:complete len:309 (+) Transcript_86909:354-1280(+)